ncbi:MAG: hypothetical protein RL885_32770 [Planctomycetota bacterium]
MMIWAFCLATTLSGLLLLPDDGSFLEVSVPKKPDAVVLRLTSDAPAVVTETRRVRLGAGSNRLRFDWIRARLDEGTLDFDVSPSSGEAKITAVTRFGHLPKMLFYDVEATGPLEAEVHARYLLSGVGWRVAYVGILHEKTADRPESLELQQTVEIQDNSGIDLEGVRIVFDGGVLEDLSVSDGQRREVETFRAAGLPFTRHYTYDPARFGGAPGVELELENAAGGPLAKSLLPAGKIRLFSKRADAAPGLIGEDVLAATPLGEKVRVLSGHERDIQVERRVVFQRNENERRDRWNKVIAYDQRTRLAFKIHNGLAEKVTLVIVERPGASFELTECELPREIQRLDTVELRVELAPRQETTFEIEWLRRNLF